MYCIHNDIIIQSYLQHNWILKTKRDTPYTSYMYCNHINKRIVVILSIQSEKRKTKNEKRILSGQLHYIANRIEGYLHKNHIQVTCKCIIIQKLSLIWKTKNAETPTKTLRHTRQTHLMRLPQPALGSAPKWNGGPSDPPRTSIHHFRIFPPAVVAPGIPKN